MTKTRVSIEEARRLSHVGRWISNPKYDPSDKSSHAEPEKLWQADYLIHMRPEPKLPEEQQYALVEKLRE